MFNSKPTKSLCQGPSNRREFLRVGASALGGLSLADVMASQTRAGTKPQLGSEKSLILFWMWGGPSQVETFDPKPNAPSDYRGPFRPIATDVPRIEICELFPQLAKQARRYSLVRSLHHEMASHNDGSIEVLTGKTPSIADPTSTAKSEHPDLGMIASRLRGARPDGLPQYIGIPTQPFMTRPQYLGVSHSAFVTGDPSADNFKPANLTIHGGLNAQRLDDRIGLAKQFDLHRQRLDAAEGMEVFHRQAVQLLTSRSVAQAFDLTREDPKLRDRYGRHLWGQSCLLARRLAEAGAGIITIDALAPKQGMPLYFSWDDHANAQPGWDLAKGMTLRAEYMDPALSALIEDIHQRGLEEKILVVAVGEFGRTPRVTMNGGNLGRDHWPQAQSALIAGGGLRMGQVVGATNSKAEYPAERPLHPQDLLATIYHHLGINHRHEFPDFSGRPIPVLPYGEPIRELV
jgi:hypothetical protein